MKKEQIEYKRLKRLVEKSEQDFTLEEQLQQKVDITGQEIDLMTKQITQLRRVLFGQGAEMQKIIKKDEGTDMTWQE